MQSFRDPNTDCSVGLYDGKPNGWERWCDCMFAKSDPNWAKCARKGCGNPLGCKNDWTGLTDPWTGSDMKLNFAPWTDVGGPARGIPLRGESVFRDIVSGLSIYPEDYSPINLWRDFNLNILRFDWLMAKISVTPFTSAAAALPLMAPPLLIAAAALECRAKGLDYNEVLVKPALQGAPANLGFLLAAIGNVTRPVELAGVALEKFCKDQISSGEDKKVSSSVVRAAMYFFRDNGASIGKTIQDTVGGADLRKATGVFITIDSTCMALFNLKNNTGAYIFDEAQRAAFSVVAVGARVAGAVSDAYNNRLGPDGYADKICLALFGFSFFQLQRDALAGPQKVQELLAGSARQGKASSPADALNALNAASQALTALIDSINLAASKLGVAGGVLADLAKQFETALGMFRGVEGDARAALQGAFAGVPQGNVSPVLQPPKLSLVRQEPLPAGGAKAQALALPATGAAAGAFIGGPVGLVVGGGVGLLLNRLGKKP